MAFSLNKAQKQQKAELLTKLRETFENLEATVASVNERLEGIRDEAESALASYAEAMAEAKAFAEEIVNDKRGEYDEKSEKWQEGDAGSSASDWISEWENASLDEPEMEFPEDIEAPEDVSESFEDLRASIND